MYVYTSSTQIVSVCLCNIVKKTEFNRKHKRSLKKFDIKELRQTLKYVFHPAPQFQCKVVNNKSMASFMTILLLRERSKSAMR